MGRLELKRKRLNKERIQHELLIISIHVSNYLADQLIKNEIQFLDSARNMYIKAPPIHSRSLSGFSVSIVLMTASISAVKLGLPSCIINSLKFYCFLHID